jgi:hypothetical protein
MTSSRMEPATFRLAAQCLNQPTACYRHMNIAYLSPIYLRSTLMLSSYLWLALWSIFLSRLLPKACMDCLCYHSCSFTYPFQPSFCQPSICWGVQIMEFLTQSSSFSPHSPSHSRGPNINTLPSTLSLCSSFNVIDQVSRPHKTLLCGGMSSPKIDLWDPAESWNCVVTPCFHLSLPKCVQGLQRPPQYDKWLCKQFLFQGLIKFIDCPKIQAQWNCTK